MRRRNPTVPSNTPRAVALGVDVHAVSARTGLGLERLVEHLLPGRTVVLSGPSGVGKSSLVNAFRGEETVVTQDVRSDGKGRHTTSYRELHRLPSGALLIDTPGLREVGLWANEEGLKRAYADVVGAAALVQGGPRPRPASSIPIADQRLQAGQTSAHRPRAGGTVLPRCAEARRSASCRRAWCPAVNRGNIHRCHRPGGW